MEIEGQSAPPPPVQTIVVSLKSFLQQLFAEATQEQHSRTLNQFIDEYPGTFTWMDPPYEIVNSPSVPEWVVDPLLLLTRAFYRIYRTIFWANESNMLYILSELRQKYRLSFFVVDAQFAYNRSSWENIRALREILSELSDDADVFTFVSLFVVSVLYQLEAAAYRYGASASYRYWTQVDKRIDSPLAYDYELSFSGIRALEVPMYILELLDPASFARPVSSIEPYQSLTLTKAPEQTSGIGESLRMTVSPSRVPIKLRTPPREILSPPKQEEAESSPSSEPVMTSQDLETDEALRIIEQEGEHMRRMRTLSPKSIDSSPTVPKKEQPPPKPTVPSSPVPKVATPPPPPPIEQPKTPSPTPPEPTPKVATPPPIERPKTPEPTSPPPPTPEPTPKVATPPPLPIERPTTPSPPPVPAPPSSLPKPSFTEDDEGSVTPPPPSPLLLNTTSERLLTPEDSIHYSDEMNRFLTPTSPYVPSDSTSPLRQHHHRHEESSPISSPTPYPSVEPSSATSEKADVPIPVVHRPLTSSSTTSLLLQSDSPQPRLEEQRKSLERLVRRVTISDSPIIEHREPARLSPRRQSMSTTPSARPTDMLTFRLYHRAQDGIRGLREYAAARSAWLEMGDPYGELLPQLAQMRKDLADTRARIETDERHIKRTLGTNAAVLAARLQTALIRYFELYMRTFGERPSIAHGYLQSERTYEQLIYGTFRAPTIDDKERFIKKSAVRV